MKINKILAASLIAAFGFTACAKDGGENTGNGNKGVAEVVIGFGKEQKETRAEENTDGTVTATPDESAVKVIEFFTFNGDAPDGTTPYFRVETTELTTTRFLVGTGARTFLVAVNARIFANNDAYIAASEKNYEGIKSKIAARVNSSTNSQTPPTSDEAFVMAAEGSTTIIEKEANLLSLTVKRVLSKIDAPVVVTGGAQTDKIAGDLNYLKEIFGDANVDAVGDVTGLTWSFDGYVVINGIDKSFNFRYVNWMGWNAGNFNWYKTKYDATGETITDVYAGSDATDKFIAASNNKPVYVYESKPKTKDKDNPSEPVTYERDQVTGFIIKGHFNALVKGTSTDSDVRYWRVNLLKKDVWEVYRNSVYRVTMENILTPGYATPKEAEEEVILDPAETSIAIDLIIADWDLRTEKVDL